MSDVVPTTASSPRPRRRGPQVLLALLLLVAVGLLVWRTWPSGPQLPLDPDAAHASGTRAVVRVLRAQGVRVDVVRTTAALQAARVDGSTTLVVTGSALHGQRGLDAVRDRARDAGGVVLAGLGTTALAGLDLPYVAVPAAEETLAAGCTVPAAAPVVGPVRRLYARAGDAAPAPWELPDDEPPTGESWGTVTSVRCYAVEDGAALVRLEPEDGPVLDLLADAGVLTNELVVGHDDAALALRLLGARDRVLWYSPDGSDTAAGEPVADDEQVAPAWFAPGVVLLLGAAALTAWWRGRRLGPLAVEPLPVLVPAAETTVARGRLYRRAGARAHAAGALRAATRRRLAERLGLPPTIGPDQLVDAVADATGRDGTAVRALLAGDAPTTDTDLAQVAQDLAALEEGITR